MAPSRVTRLAQVILGRGLAFGIPSRFWQRPYRTHLQLRYREPPDWVVPVRHALGVFLLHDGQHAEAEAVYREDLRRWPDNGWSLHGLSASLEAQDKKTEAAKVRARFDEIWKHADVKITSSCFCQK